MSILVSGILKSPAGAVIAGAQITLTALTTSPDLLAGVSASAVTSDTGYYGLNVLPGAYSLTVAVNGKSQVYGSFRLDGTETAVTLNMVLRRNLVEVSIPGELLTGFRQIQNNVADDLETIRQLEFRASGSADNAAKSAAGAKVSAEAAARSEANAAGSEKNAEQFAQNLQDAVAKAGDAVSAAALSASEAEKQAVSASGSAAEAKQSALAAQQAATTAATDAAEKVAPVAAEQVRAKVAAYADSASQAAVNAANSKNAAEKAASGAALSEKSAAGSALAARTSETSAADSATKSVTSEKAAALHEQASATHETNAGQSAAEAALSAMTSSEKAGSAEMDAQRAETARAAAESAAANVDVHEAPSDGICYVRKNSAWIQQGAFDVGVTASTGEVNSTAHQLFTLDGTKNNAVTFTGLPAGRALVIVLVFKGAGGTVTWPDNLTWSQNAPPKLADTRTVISVLWDGEALTGTTAMTV
ncbi:TPA: carboxypeptidase-like regulatory domain-containing protein [Salmonella enterica subsp. diarizonae serovar 61:i:z]